jgi:anti-sigma28 factor (negative regulator of flagellin synthesis)
LTKTPEEYAEELKNVETFDLNASLSGVTRPKDEITIYTDGERAHQLEEVLTAISSLGREKATLPASGGITGNPRADEIDEEIKELEEASVLLVQEIRSSSLTFHLRGLAPKQTRLIVKSWDKKIKPEGKNPSDDELAEANEQRVEKINAELIAKCTYKVVKGDGAEHNGAVSIERVESLRDEINTGEFQRLVDVVNSLCVAHGLFNNMLASDADFLSKS